MATKLNAPRATADRIGVSPGTLAVWRCTARYPLAYVRIGSRIFYTDEAIEKFIRSRTVTPGGESEERPRRRASCTGS